MFWCLLVGSLWGSTAAGSQVLSVLSGRLQSQIHGDEKFVLTQRKVEKLNYAAWISIVNFESKKAPLGAQKWQNRTKSWKRKKNAFGHVINSPDGTMSFFRPGSSTDAFSRARFLNFGARRLWAIIPGQNLGWKREQLPGVNLIGEQFRTSIWAVRMFWRQEGHGTVFCAGKRYPPKPSFIYCLCLIVLLGAKAKWQSLLLLLLLLIIIIIIIIIHRFGFLDDKCLFLEQGNPPIPPFPTQETLALATAKLRVHARSVGKKATHADLHWLWGTGPARLGEGNMHSWRTDGASILQTSDRKGKFSHIICRVYLNWAESQMDYQAQCLKRSDRIW